MIDRSVTGHEIIMKPTQTIQSRTDPRGVINYVNQTLIDVSGYSREELIGKPHSLLRHPDMPRSVFYVLWETIQSGKEFYGYVVNRAQNGDHYWVIAYVAPRFDAHGQVIGYSSVRRAPLRDRLPEWEELYAAIREVEAKVDRNQQCEVGKAFLLKYLKRSRFDDLTQYVLAGL